MSDEHKHSCCGMPYDGPHAPTCDSPKFHERIQAQCDTIHDQRWMLLGETDRFARVLRIAMHGPGADDVDFVKSVMVTVGYELAKRQRERKAMG